MKKTLLFLAVVLMGMSMMAQTTYTKITSAAELEADANYLIVGYDDALGYCAMSYQKSANRHAIQVSENGGTITAVPATDPNSQTEVHQIRLGGSTGAWTFFDELKNGYLYAASSSANQLKTQTTNTANGEWSIVFESDGTAIVTAQGDNTRNVMRFNENSQNGAPLFNCYLPTSTAGVAVMFYKEGGAPVIYPEPSNYPSAFYSALDKVNVTLDWTDAVGEQLPAKYLVVASTGAIQVPTDGVPVPNGALAKNVSYGVQTVTFTGLNGATTYNFAIFPYTNSGENINYKTDGDYPTASETTDDVTLLFASDFANSLAPFTAYDVEGEQGWATGAYQGTPYAKMSGYAGGTNYPNEDWLITPDLLHGYTSNEIEVNFMNAYKFDGDPLKVLYTEDYDGMSDPNEFAWVDITDNFEWSAGEYAWATTSYTLVNMQDLHHMYLAFKYTSTDTASSTWEVAEVQIYGIGYTSVAENAATLVNIYPNPAENSVNIVAENDANVQIIDMVGRTVMSIDVVEGVNTVSVADLESGVYFVRMNGAVVKFIKK